MKRLKSLFRDVGRFKVHKESGYKVDRRLVKATTMIILIYLLFSFFWGLGHEKYYLACPGPTQCQNPFYGLECAKYGVPDSICGLEELYVGFESGYKAPSIIQDSPAIAIFLLFVSVLINHFVYNNKGGGY